MLQNHQATIGLDMRMLMKQRMIQIQSFVSIQDTILLRAATAEIMLGINGIENIFGHNLHILQVHLITIIFSLAKVRLITTAVINHMLKAARKSLLCIVVHPNNIQQIANKPVQHLNLVMPPKAKSQDLLCMEQLCTHTL